MRYAAMALMGLLAAPAWGQERGARSDDVDYAADADADRYVPAPRDRLWYSNATYVRVNPLGLVNQHRIGWRRRLSTVDHLLLRDTYAFAAGAVTVTPAWARVGGYAEVLPLAVLRLFTEVTAVSYFGTFDQVLLFDDGERYSDQSIEARGDEASARSGLALTFGGTLRAAAGPMAVRSTYQVQRIGLSGLDDGQLFYEQLSDRLAPNNGWVWLNDADVLYVQGKLRLGARLSSSGTPAAPEGTDAAIGYHRLGPLFAWQFDDHPPGKRFNQPTLFVLAQWWLQHPYRTGNEQPQGLPLIAVGFAFNGDHATSAMPTP
jgi:hypothetical protein